MLVDADGLTLYLDDSDTQGTATGSSGAYAPDATYALVVVDSEGVTERVATWEVVPGRTITVPAATDRHPDRIVSIELQTSDGRALLATDLS